jgi:hypothetical protein
MRFGRGIIISLLLLLVSLPFLSLPFSSHLHLIHLNGPAKLIDQQTQDSISQC